MKLQHIYKYILPGILILLLIITSIVIGYFWGKTDKKVVVQGEEPVFSQITRLAAPKAVLIKDITEFQRNAITGEVERAGQASAFQLLMLEDIEQPMTQVDMILKQEDLRKPYVFGSNLLTTDVNGNVRVFHFLTGTSKFLQIDAPEDRKIVEFFALDDAIYMLRGQCLNTGPCSLEKYNLKTDTITVFMDNIFAFVPTSYSSEIHFRSIGGDSVQLLFRGNINGKSTVRIYELQETEEKLKLLDEVAYQLCYEADECTAAQMKNNEKYNEVQKIAPYECGEMEITQEDKDIIVKSGEKTRKIQRVRYIGCY